MHITILAVGTRGDAQPLIALAKGLHMAGHEVRVVTTREFTALVREQGGAYFGLRASLSEMVQTGSRGFRTDA